MVLRYTKPQVPLYFILQSTFLTDLLIIFVKRWQCLCRREALLSSITNYLLNCILHYYLLQLFVFIVQTNDTKSNKALC